jgi:hypothetical protein
MSELSAKSRNILKNWTDAESDDKIVELVSDWMRVLPHEVADIRTAADELIARLPHLRGRVNAAIEEAIERRRVATEQLNRYWKYPLLGDLKHPLGSASELLAQMECYDNTVFIVLFGPWFKTDIPVERDNSPAARLVRNSHGPESCVSLSDEEATAIRNQPTPDAALLCLSQIAHRHGHHVLGDTADFLAVFIQTQAKPVEVSQ